MKNYKVEVTMKFTDKEENIKRVPYDKNLSESENEEKGSIFYCTKERYEFLKKNNAVKLIEIVEEKEELVATEEPIIEEIPNATGEVEVALLNDEKPKKKKSNKK